MVQNSLRSFFFFVIFSSLILLLPQRVSADSCGGTRLCQCGDTVTSDYVMPADLGPCDARGLAVASGVTLDCNNHALRGHGNQSQNFGIVLTTGTTEATVKNCEVSGFQRGIRLRAAHHNQIIGNTAHDNGDFTARVGYGIDLAQGSTENALRQNRVHHNADEGIHIGTGSHRNRLIDNQVFANVRENIYILRANDGVIKGNSVKGGGANSLFLKHAVGYYIAHNHFHDKTVLIRGDAKDNRFISNNYVGAGIHFQAYKEGTDLRSPTKNMVRGGTVSGAKACLRFSNASGNVIQDLSLDGCKVEVSSTGAEVHANNTLLGMLLNQQKISLDSHSTLQVGWYLDVAVHTAEGIPVSNARVRGVDIDKNLLFDTVTSNEGKIPTQKVITRVHNGSRRTARTPYVLHITAGPTTVARKISIAHNTTLTVVLPASPASTP
jgi:parallel beta-helix repeat protein